MYELVVIYSHRITTGSFVYESYNRRTATDYKNQLSDYLTPEIVLFIVERKQKDLISSDNKPSLDAGCPLMSLYSLCDVYQSNKNTIDYIAPKEIWSQHILPGIPSSDMLSLSRTCRYFYNQMRSVAVEMDVSKPLESQFCTDFLHNLEILHTQIVNVKVVEVGDGEQQLILWLQLMSSRVMSNKKIIDVRLDMSRPFGKDFSSVRKALPCLISLTKLTSLNIGGIGIAVDEIRHVAALTQLKSLDISFNYLGDNGIHPLSSLINLTQLNIRMNQLGSTGTQPLSSLTNLTRLDISHNSAQHQLMR